MVKYTWLWIQSYKIYIIKIKNNSQIIGQRQSNQVWDAGVRPVEGQSYLCLMLNSLFSSVFLESENYFICVNQAL